MYSAIEYTDSYNAMSLHYFKVYLFIYLFIYLLTEHLHFQRNITAEQRCTNKH